MTDFFEPEFINRIDETTIFHEIGPDAARDIVRRELDAMMARAKRRGIEVGYTDRVVDKILADGFDPTYGARSVRRTIQRLIAPQLARQVVTHRVDKLAGDDGVSRWRLDEDHDRFLLTAAQDDQA